MSTSVKIFCSLQILAILSCLLTIYAEEYELNNGLKIPAAGLGTSHANNLQDVVKAAVNMGYRLIDTAAFYKNEDVIGKGLKAVFHENSTRREDLFIVSKLANDQHRPSDVLPAIKKSLQDLQLEYLDLYLIHWPFAVLAGSNDTAEDTNVTIEETWRAMEELVKQGYTKSIGLSNFNSLQVERILKIATIKPVVNQVECNPYMSQEKLREFCKQKGILVMAYSPLYSGRSKDKLGLNIFKDPLIEQLALKYKKNHAQIVLRYLVQCRVIPIPKADKLHHLQSNINIFDFALTPEDFEKMRGLNRNQRIVEVLKYRNFTEFPFAAEF